MEREPDGKGQDEAAQGMAEDGPSEGGDIRVKQDGYRHVMFGQIADGLLPPHQGAPESSDDELLRAAMSDPDAIETEEPPYQPTAWRVVFLLVMVAISLAIVFWKK